MTSKSLQDELLKKIQLLEEDQQNKVLLYVKTLLVQNKRVALTSFAGLIDPLSIQEMSIAIEEGCENIDNNEW